MIEKISLVVLSQNNNQTISPIEEETLFTVESDGFFAKKYKLVTQYGTHIDAPIHFANNTRFLDELDLKELVLSLFVIHKEKRWQKTMIILYQ